MVDVIREESESEVLSLAGLREEEDMFSSVEIGAELLDYGGIEPVHRIHRLAVIGAFEAPIAQIVALATLMPIVSGIGGNTGTQTSTLIIRAICTGPDHRRHHPAADSRNAALRCSTA